MYLRWKIHLRSYWEHQTQGGERTTNNKKVSPFPTSVSDGADAFSVIVPYSGSSGEDSVHSDIRPELDSDSETSGDVYLGSISLPTRPEVSFAGGAA